MPKPSPSDLTDAPWAIIEPLIPVHRVRRPRTNDMREVHNAIFYLHRSGCQGDLLPHVLPAKSTVYNPFAQWRDDGTEEPINDVLLEVVSRPVGSVGFVMLPRRWAGSFAWLGRYRRNSR